MDQGSFGAVLAVTLAVTLPKAAAIEKLDGPLMGAARIGRQKGAPSASPEGTLGPYRSPRKVKS